MAEFAFFGAMKSSVSSVWSRFAWRVARELGAEGREFVHSSTASSESARTWIHSRLNRPVDISTPGQ